MIIANINYQASCFGDYSKIVYNNENVIKVLRSFDDLNLVPTNIVESRPNLELNQRLSFASLDGLFGISIFSERIDIRRTSNKRNGFDEEEIDLLSKELIDCLIRIRDIFSDGILAPYRLVWFVSYVIFEMTEEEKKSSGIDFLRPLSSIGKIDWMICRFVMVPERMSG